MSTIDNKTITSGVTLGTSGSYASPLTITSTGAIEPHATGGLVSYTAVYASGSLAATVINHGTIADVFGPADFGIKLNGGGYVANSGAIGGLVAGVFIGGLGTVVNSGNIFTGVSGSVGISLASGVVINNKGASASSIRIGSNGTVINAGRVSSEDGALTGTGVNTVVINSGTIEGLEANGVVVGGPATIVNSGIISGIVGVGINGPATIVNSGSSLCGNKARFAAWRIPPGVKLP